MTSSSTDFAINIIGNGQNAVKAFNDVGDAAQNQSAKFDKVKAGITVASAAIVAGVAKFGADSVAAYAEAEQSQAALVAAYEKFPAVASVSIDALRALNTETQRKTGFDDDALAASQSTLAQFGLTGEQIQQLTPLMADYAAKTGKDITTAAEDMGKAVMGQGRALKTVGVDFTDTGNAAGNFDQLVAGLDGTVGGFAETMGDTAAGKAKILEQSFGDIQETVGEMLIPALTWLTEVGTSVTQWLSDNPAIVQALAIVVGVLTLMLIGLNVAIWASNAALLANPITWIILAVVALVAAIVILALNWETVWQWVQDVTAGFVSWITTVFDGFVSWWNQLWGAVGQFVADVWNNGIVGPIKAAIDWVVNTIQVGLSLVQLGWERVWNGIVATVKGVWNGILGFIEKGVNGAIDLINGMISGIRDAASVIGIEVGVIPHIKIPRLATGTVTSGPMLAMIGDNPGGREVVAPYDSYVDELRRAAGIGRTNGNGTSGPQRLAREDLDYLAEKVAAVLHPAMVSRAQSAVIAAIAR